MQKIQFYLVPNRVTVTTDMAGFNTEYRQVYQRTIKLHKGIDNTIELEVKNSDQRRQDVVGWNVVIKFFDAERSNLFSAVGTSITSKPGLMSATISRATLEKIDAQQLTAAAFLVKDGEEKILYSDSQFDVLARVEILDAYNDAEDLADEVTVFNWEYDRKQFISEIANFGNRHNEDYSTAPGRSMTVEMIGTYEGIIEVEATKDKSTAFGTTWTKIDNWDTRIETIKVITEPEPWRFVRFVHGGGRPGAGATFNVTIEDSKYTVVAVIHRGQDYNVSDILTIKGSYLGGDDDINDLSITVGAVNEYPPGSINSVTGISWTGQAPAQNGYYRNVKAINIVSANPVDKIIVRN